MEAEEDDDDDEAGNDVVTLLGREEAMRTGNKQETGSREESHHVPGEVGQPVDGGVDAADKLQMLGFANPLLDEEEDKAGGDEGHGEDDTDGHHHVGGAGGPATATWEREVGVSEAESARTLGG